jgi:hypothetical protein
MCVASQRIPIIADFRQDTELLQEAGSVSKWGAFCVPSRLKSGASGLRPGDGLRRLGRRRATMGAEAPAEPEFTRPVPRVDQLELQGWRVCISLEHAFSFTETP